MTIKTWNIEQMTGYKPQTTFFEDFSIADKFGTKAVEDTYKNAIKTAKFLGKIYLAELVMALNWKIWQHYDEGNETFARVYDRLWKLADGVAVKTLKGEDLNYYFRTID